MFAVHVAITVNVKSWKYHSDNHRKWFIVNKELVIAIDVMGGDQAPGMVLDGANIASERYPEAKFLLFGPEDRITKHLSRLKRLRNVSDIIHTDEIVSNEMKASVALRKARSSSMGLAIQAVKRKQADCVISAGNTGALMAMSKIMLGMLPGVKRPAIASFFPTSRGESVMLDLGANLQCDTENLVQFAVMGEAFASKVLGIKYPSVGLLNVGTEEQKGHDEIRQAAAFLRDHMDMLDFQGFVEGSGIPAGLVDVIVADGFSGNIALKTAEGTAKLYTDFTKEIISHSFFAKLGYLLAKPAFGKLRERLDARRYNGAVMLGLNGVTVKSHGGTDELGFATAIGVGVDMVKYDYNDAILKEFESLAHKWENRSLTPPTEEPISPDADPSKSKVTLQ